MSERPWLYPFVEDPGGSRLDRDVLRPLVQVAVEGPRDSTRVWALVDSGCEHVLVAPWIARLTGIATDPDRWIPLGIAGSTVRVEFGHTLLKLPPPEDIAGQPAEWECEVGVVKEWRATWGIVLGQVGFFDRFTVTMHRSAQATAIEGHGTFDARFGIVYQDQPDQLPRFSP